MEPLTQPTFFASLFRPASVGSGDFVISGPAIFVLVMAVAVLVAVVASLVWLYRDAAKRGKHGFVAILFVLLTGYPASFIWWFWLRPGVRR